MPKAKAKPTTAKKSPATASFLLLDRSGSMGGAMWIEALGSINAYVKAVAEKLPQDKVTMAVFDGANNFEVIRDAVVAKSWPVVTDKDASPRGSTPLYDAIVKLCASATKEAIKKTTIVIMTDGAENASQEATKDTARLLLMLLEKRDGTFYSLVPTLTPCTNQGTLARKVCTPLMLRMAAWSIPWLGLWQLESLAMRLARWTHQPQVSPTKTEPRQDQQR